jgi:uncharacterized protein (DUF58 family)
MIPKELFQKVRRIEITTSRLVTDVFAGQYHSVFKGQGIEFDEVREYQPGDDVRTIDWNVTARTGRAHIKKFVEERELTVMILVDASRSCRFASVNMLKSQLAAEISSLFALSAIRNNDKVGLIIFTDRIEKFIPPAKGVRHVLYIIREVLYFKPKGRLTDIAQALQYLDRVINRKSISLLISDFFEDTPERLEALTTAMAIARRRHDLIPITLNDPRERHLPQTGLIALEDAETGQTGLVDASSTEVREAYKNQNIRRVSERERLFRSIGVDFIDVSTQEPYADALIKFFRKRKKR